MDTQPPLTTRLRRKLYLEVPWVGTGVSRQKGAVPRDKTTQLRKIGFLEGVESGVVEHHAWFFYQTGNNWSTVQHARHQTEALTRLPQSNLHVVFVDIVELCRSRLPTGRFRAISIHTTRGAYKPGRSTVRAGYCRRGILSAAYYMQGTRPRKLVCLSSSRLDTDVRRNLSLVNFEFRGYWFLCHFLQTDNSQRVDWNLPACLTR